MDPPAGTKSPRADRAVVGIIGPQSPESVGSDQQADWRASHWIASTTWQWLLCDAAIMWRDADFVTAALEIESCFAAFHGELFGEHEDDGDSADGPEQVPQICPIPPPPEQTPDFEHWDQ